MPRRYHRPPAAKRRKARRTGPSLPYEETPPADGAQPEDQSSDELADDQWEDDEEEYEDEPAAAVATATAPPRSAAREGARHIQRDYSYVRTELRRVMVVAAVLFVALVIIAFLR